MRSGQRGSRKESSSYCILRKTLLSSCQSRFILFSFAMNSFLSLVMFSSYLRIKSNGSLTVFSTRRFVGIVRKEKLIVIEGSHILSFSIII